MASDSINPTTPADAQFEAAIAHAWNARALLKYDPISLDEIAHAEFEVGANFGREWERKAALESEPVKALVEALRDLRNICMDGKFYEDHQKAKALIGQATSAIHAFERAKGGGK